MYGITDFFKEVIYITDNKYSKGTDKCLFPESMSW